MVLLGDYMFIVQLSGQTDTSEVLNYL